MQTQFTAQMTFAQKLEEILNTQEFCNIIRKSSSNYEFQIWNIQSLESDVLPLFFKHSNIQSFKRQLNLYGFKRVKNQRCAKYMHKLLKQGKKMKDLKNKHQILRQKKSIVKEQQNLRKNLQNQENLNFSDRKFDEEQQNLYSNEQIVQQNQNLQFTKNILENEKYWQNQGLSIQCWNIYQWNYYLWSICQQSKNRNFI